MDMFCGYKLKDAIKAHYVKTLIEAICYNIISRDTFENILKSKTEVTIKETEIGLILRG